MIEHPITHCRKYCCDTANPRPVVELTDFSHRQTPAHGIGIAYAYYLTFPGALSGQRLGPAAEQQESAPSLPALLFLQRI